MRVLICLMSLLGGCSTPAVRCDAHLQPINAPTPRTSAGSAKPAAAEAKPAGERSTP